MRNHLSSDLELSRKKMRKNVTFFYVHAKKLSYGYSLVRSDALDKNSTRDDVIHNRYNNKGKNLTFKLSPLKLPRLQAVIFNLLVGTA